MGKDIMVSVDVDVEEGEISDSASVEEISAEVFSANKSSEVVSVNKNVLVEDSKQQQQHQQQQQQSQPQLWTMQDLVKYQKKYQTSRNYAPGLYNFAWAQAVQNKPLDDYLTTLNTNTSTKQSNNSVVVKEEESVNNDKVIVDISGDDDADSEKEEGEIEEGEIDLDTDTEVVNTEVDANAGKQGGDEGNVEKCIEVIRIGLEGITVSDANK